MIDPLEKSWCGLTFKLYAEVSGVSGFDEDCGKTKVSHFTEAEMKIERVEVFHVLWGKDEHAWGRRSPWVRVWTDEGQYGLDNQPGLGLELAEPELQKRIQMWSE